MRVLYIYDGDWPKAATRVRKQTRALADAGSQVLLLSRNETRQPRVQTEDWMQVRRLPTAPGSLLNRLVNFPLPFSPTWAAALSSAYRSFQPEIILVEDLPLAPLAVALGGLLGLPVVYDMGEVYPEFLRGLHAYKRPSISDRILRNPRPAEILERFVLRRVAHTFVVSEESRNRAVLRGAHSTRISIVGNTPEDPDSLCRPHPRPASLEALDGRRIVLFVGILISDRGIGVAVEAMRNLRSKVPDAALVLVGDGLERPALERQVERCGLGDCVFFAGWQEYESLPAFYQHADVGLLPFLDGGQIRYTLANKLFDYMGSALPVVASDVPPMRRVLSEARVGFLVRPGDPASLADGIGKVLCANSEERRRMGEAGRRLVREKYNWGQDARRFTDGLRDAVRAHRRGRNR